MNRKILGILVAELLITSVTPVVGLINETYSGESKIDNLQQFSGITFYQVDYDWEKTKYKDSNTGEIVIDIEKVKKETGLESGYVNVYSEQGWIIQNLVFTENFPYPYLSRFFDLGRTGDVISINVYIQVTTEPVSVFEYSGVLPPYTVYDTIYDAEGGGENIEFQRPQPPPPNIPGVGDFQDPYENFIYLQGNHPNVASAKNQCVPCAYANNLQYLENEFGTLVNDELIPGFNGSPPSSLPAIFDVIMERIVVDNTNGSPTKYSKALEGFVKYTYFESLAISLKHQGDVLGTEDVTYLDTTSHGQGWSISIDFIFDEMIEGHSVAVAYNRYLGTNKVSGHMAQLIAAGKILGVPFIQYLDDRNQGNLYGEIRIVQTFLRDWDWDGKINLLNLDWTVTGPPEINQIVVMAAENLPPFKPSTPSGGSFIMKTGTIIGFSTSTTDPNGDQIWYLFDWGDGTFSDWIGPKESGELASGFTVWDTEGFYNIKVKARDFYGAESEWSDERLCILPKIKSINVFNPWIIRLIERSPILEFLL